jgi:GR25 family glycosyltransferase involved in LPS biosynthesis
MQQWCLICGLAVLCACDDRGSEPNGLPTSSDVKATYYINLDDVPLRRWHMEQQLHYTGFPAKRFSAIASSRVAAGEFNKDYLHPQGLDESTLQKSEGVAHATAACFISHVELLKRLSKELKPQDVGLIMEDDVVIPTDWSAQIQAAIRGAPKDWHLLKVSGWGSGREEDIVSQPSSWSKLNGYFFRPFKEKVPEFKYYSMKAPFTDPQEPMRYFYAGSGAYLVRGFAIPSILQHLQTRPIKDMDSMLLHNGSNQIYEEWPHIFDLSKDSFGIHSHDSGAAEAEAVEKLEQTEKLKQTTLGWKRASKRAEDSLTLDPVVASPHEKRHARQARHILQRDSKLLEPVAVVEAPRFESHEEAPVRLSLATLVKSAKEHNVFLGVQSTGDLLQRH